MDPKLPMTIVLVCQSPAPELPALPAEGPGGPALCSPNAEAVATAQRRYPDRRIEVHERFREPGLAGATSPAGRLRRLRWMLRPGPGDESAESVRRRVIDSTVRLVELAKAHQESTLVAGPWLLGLVAFKLNGIGYRGPILRTFKSGESRQYRYGA
ncbi:MAG TPA: hypothetical protein VNZ67_02935 [bacterium]|nr:hypothetical protein [bacterium]